MIRSNLAKCVILFCISASATTAAMADCSNGVPDTTCPPGSIGNLLGNSQTQMQDELNREAAAQAQRDAQAQAQRDADLKNMMEQSGAAANPYYQGTQAQQCEAAKRSLFCQLGFSCATPPDLDCAHVEARPAVRHHHKHHQ